LVEKPNLSWGALKEYSFRDEVEGIKFQLVLPCSTCLDQDKTYNSIQKGNSLTTT